MESKVCPRCKVIKPNFEYSNNKTRKDGLMRTCKACCSEVNKKSYYKNREKRKAAMSKYYEANKEREKERSSQYAKNNREKRLEYLREYREKNIDKLREKAREYTKDRKKRDPLFKLKSAIRINIYFAFNRYKEGSKVQSKSYSEELLGCSLEYFVSYISEQFTEGMTLENHGEWHLDHIIPLATANTEEDVIRLCHYSNYQPLWAKDNLSKGSKILPE